VVVSAQVLVAQVMGEHRVERRLAAILCADVAGYSRLMGNDEEGTLARLKRLRRELTDPKIEQHHGHIVKTTGDGILVEFASVVEAVQCAVEVQQDIAERNAEMPIEQRIELRTGINLGDTSSMAATYTATASMSRRASRAWPGPAASACRAPSAVARGQEIRREWLGPRPGLAAETMTIARRQSVLHPSFRRHDVRGWSVPIDVSWSFDATAGRCMMSCLATAEAVFNLNGAHHNRQWRRVSGRAGLFSEAAAGRGYEPFWVTLRRVRTPCVGVRPQSSGNAALEEAQRVALGPPVLLNLTDKRSTIKAG
jgi:hypothetical protein